jgi:hypothetical protein
MKPFNCTATFYPTIEELAEYIAYLAPDDQARLISHIASISKAWKNPRCSGQAQQLAFIRDSLWLSDEGRALMNLIGDYAHPEN